MSIPNLHTHAVHFFLLAEQAFRLWWGARRLFWNDFPSSVPNPAVYLPAMVAAVREEYNLDVRQELARYPLPSRVPPEAVPWYDSLVAAWKAHQTADLSQWHNLAWLALVRLDGCSPPAGMPRPSRLPEYLEEARQIAGTTSRSSLLETLAALAAWRPAPDVITAPETLQDWVALWQKMRQSRSPLLKGIAAKALLNLPEADLRSASIPILPASELLHELATALRVAAEKTARNTGYNYLLMLDWQPAEGASLPAVGLAEVAHAWLEVTRHENWRCRATAWQQLVHWERTGTLTACGIDLLPHLLSAVKDEKNSEVLSEMAHWTPTSEALTRARTGSDFVLLRELEIHWQAHRQSESWLERESGWLGSFHLHQAGLASESPVAFLKAYLSAVAQESRDQVLFVLAQWSPGANAPADLHQAWKKIWQRRLGDGDESIRQVANFALLRQGFEKRAGDTLRHAALGAWWGGEKEADRLMHLSGGVTSHFHEVRGRLAAGSVPEFQVHPSAPAERQRPRLALPPGRITGGEWKMENGEWRIENGK